MKIGMVGQYGFPRGICNIYNMIAKVLKDKHELFLLQRGENEWSDEFEKIDNVQKLSKFDIPKETFKTWLTDNKIDLVIFNEEQWIGELQTDELVDVCKELKVKSLHYVVWEKINLQQFDYYEKFDKIICPTVSCYKKLKGFGFENIKYVRWGADKEIFSPSEKFKKKIKDKIVFFHPGGFGGIYNRKQMDEVVDAFTSLKNNDKAVLIVTRQDIQNFGNKPGNYKHNEYDNIEFYVGNLKLNDLKKFYQEADIVVLPSKWEGNGLPFHEALAMGCPVITIDAEPMNEIIKDGINGLCAKVEKLESYDNIFVDGNVVDVNSLKSKMNIAMTPMLLEVMKKNAKKTSDEIWDWKENSKELIKIIEECENEN